MRLLLLLLMSVLLGQRLDGGAVRTAADEGRRSWFGWTSPPRCVHDAASKRQLEGRQGDVGRQAAPTPTLLADSRQVLQRIDEIDCVVDSGQVDDWLLRRAALAEKELLRKMEQAQPFDLDTRGDRMDKPIAELEAKRAALNAIIVKSARRVVDLTDQLNEQKERVAQATRELNEQAEQMKALGAQLLSLKGQLYQ